MYEETIASLPYLHSRYLCSLERVTPYPTLGVPSLPYLLLLTCVDSNGYPPPIFGVLPVHPVALHS